MIEAHHHDLAAVIMEPFQRLIVPQPGFLAGRAGDHRAARRPADLRRDRHRLPLRLRRRPGILRRRAGPGRLRQDHRRRLPARRGRGPPRHHAALRTRDDARPASSSRRARSTATRSRPRRASPPWPSCADPGPTSASSPPAPGSSRVSRRPRAGPDSAAQVAGEAPVFEIYFTDRPITDYRATLSADQALHAAFTREMLTRGAIRRVEASAATAGTIFDLPVNSAPGTCSYRSTVSFNPHSHVSHVKCQCVFGVGDVLAGVGDHPASCPLRWIAFNGSLRQLVTALRRP